MEKNFWQRYVELKNEIKVPKTKDNKFGGFKYRNLEQIQEILKPLELKHNILFFSTEDTVIMEDNTRHCVATLEVIDTLTGEVKLKTKSSAEYQKNDSTTKMNASQLSGSASSYATKYVYARALGLDDTKDADDEDLTETKQQEKKVIRRPEPQEKVEAKVETMKPFSVEEPEVETKEDNKPQLLAKLKQSTLEMKSEEDVNKALDILEKLGGDEATSKVINMKAKTLGLTKNLKTDRWFKLGKEGQ